MTQIYCIADSHQKAENIVTSLRDAGLPAEDVSVLYPDNAKTGVHHVNATKVPEGAATGTIAGGLAGGVAGWLAGIGVLAIPGVGPFVAAGPIMATLGAGAAGAAVGGLGGALIGLGIPEYEATEYEGRLKKGGILVAARTRNDSETNRVKKIFRDADAESVSTSEVNPAEAR